MSEDQVWLEECFQSELFMLAAQPIFEASSMRRVAFELLLRSGHAALATPDRIFAAAEAAGRVSDVSAVVMKQAATLCKDLGGQPHLFINLHSLDLADARLLARNLAPLERYAERVVFEISERSHLDAIPAWREALFALRRMHFGIALDDLGEGYSSLKMLSELRPRYIKLDRSLVQNIHGDRWRERLIASVAGFCRDLDICLIGEGVEEQPDADLLVELGVDWLQGFLFGRPTVRL